MKPYFLFLSLMSFLSQPIFAQCSTYVQMVYHDVESCTLPVIVESGEVLFPCSAPVGFDEFDEGEYAYVDYELSGCITFCQFGTQVNITCLSLLTGIQNQQQDPGIKVYPTLVKDFVFIEGKELQRVEFYDTQGMPALKLDDFKTAEIDISGLPRGVYFVKVITKSSTQCITLMKI